MVVVKYILKSKINKWKKIDGSDWHVPIPESENRDTWKKKHKNRLELGIHFLCLIESHLWKAVYHKEGTCMAPLSLSVCLCEQSVVLCYYYLPSLTSSHSFKCQKSKRESKS